MIEDAVAETGDLFDAMNLSIRKKHSNTEKNYDTIQSVYQASINKNSGKSREDFAFSEVVDDSNLLTGNLYMSGDKKWCYQIGVIDYLQTYNF